MESKSSETTYLGTSLADLYQSQGPWCFSTSALSPSKYHHVLFEVPATLNKPPRPHINSQTKHWNEDYVRMPYSPQSSYLVKENGEEVVKPRWEVICDALSQPIKTVRDLEVAIGKYNNTVPKFSALHYLFNDVFSEEETEHFFNELLPGIITLALSLTDLIPGNIPLLKQNHCKSLSLSQLQVACLMANAFLCTFLWKKEASTYRGVNFFKLFISDNRASRKDCVAEKLKCILHYFRRVIKKHPVGVITFERKSIPKNLMPRWDTLDCNLGNTKIHVTSTGIIEDAAGLLQVDFANRFIGGGVLGYGCVQEEIRFIICPELIISRLFTEELGNNESLVIYGAERYSNYTGYADGFKWAGDHTDVTPFDEHGRRRTTVVAIDATRFNRSKDQYHCSVMLRELNKAYAGFQSREKKSLAPVATGNWGCGAFNGDPRLKSLLQLMACTAANRNLVYYSFGDVVLRDAFYQMHCFLAANQVSVALLWRYLCRFCAASVSPEKLYSYIQQCHFDTKSQPTLKQFITITQKRKTEAPSTSTATPSTSGTMATVETSSSETSKKKEAPPAVETPAKKSPPTKTNGRIGQSNSRTVVADDVMEIIDLIDGKSRTTQRSDSDFTFLTELERKNKRDRTNSDVRIEMPMEVDSEPPSIIVKDKKQKITDYFTKM